MQKDYTRLVEHLGNLCGTALIRQEAALGYPSESKQLLSTQVVLSEEARHYRELAEELHALLVQVEAIPSSAFEEYLAGEERWMKQKKILR
jgi:hypothetical protein